MLAEKDPSILTNIDTDRARTWLIAHFPREQSAAVRAAIGRSIENRDLSDQLLNDFKSEDEKTRAAACFLAGWHRPDDRKDRALSERINDRSDRVIRAAIDARNRRAEPCHGGFCYTKFSGERHCCIRSCEYGV